MNELFPIIRRKRRPFLVEESGMPTAREDARPTESGNGEPSKVEMAEPNTTQATEDGRRANDAKATSQRKSR
mgnify:CR=1 FL=1